MWLHTSLEAKEWSLTKDCLGGHAGGAQGGRRPPARCARRAGRLQHLRRGLARGRGAACGGGRGPLTLRVRGGVGID